MSFVGANDVMSLTEGLLVEGARAIGAPEPQIPFPRMHYDEAMRRFGTDRPDTRFGLEITEISDLMRESKARILAEAVTRGGAVAGIVAEDGKRLSRRELDELVAWVQTLGAGGLAWIRAAEDGGQAVLAKCVGAGARKICERTGLARRRCSWSPVRATTRCRSSASCGCVSGRSSATSPRGSGTTCG
jgi:aspartyl-tRNA synthetase